MNSDNCKLSEVFEKLKKNNSSNALLLSISATIEVSMENGIANVTPHANINLQNEDGTDIFIPSSDWMHNALLAKNLVVDTSDLIKSFNIIGSSIIHFN